MTFAFVELLAAVITAVVTFWQWQHAKASRRPLERQPAPSQPFRIVIRWRQPTVHSNAAPTSSTRAR